MRRVTGAEAVESYREQLEAGTMIINGVAEEVALFPSTVRGLCRKLGIAFVHARRGAKPGTPRKPGKLGITALKVATYREQLEKGQLSMAAVGKELGISREYVRQLCKKLEIKPVQPSSCLKCSTVLLLEEKKRHFCNGCKPRQRVRIAWCVQCGQPYAMTGEKRSRYIENRKRGTKDSRCPECLKAASKKYKRITVQCLDCGTDVERMQYAYYQSRQKGVNGPVCNECRGKRMFKSNAAKVLMR